MDIAFNCPHCGQHLSVEDRGAGMLVNCPSCNKQVEIPKVPVGATTALPPTTPAPDAEMNQAPKQPNVFGQVLAAILVAAAIGGVIFGIYKMHSDIQATDKAHKDLENVLRRTDFLIRKSPTPSGAEVTLTKVIPFEMKYGRVTLYPGTKLELVERNGDRVRVRYEGALYDIEITATDLK